MNKIKFDNYNLHVTLLGGQSFSWIFDDGYYIGVMQNKILKLKQDNDILYWQTYPTQDDEKFVMNYLYRGPVHYDVMLKNVIKDNHLKSAFNKYPHIRLLNQEFEHTLLSFLISSNNSIKSIRTRIRKLSQLYGEKIVIADKDYYLFPKTEVLADFSDVQIANSGLGYRGEYVVNAAKTMIQTDVVKQILDNSLNRNESEVRELLLGMKGIGEKVADCIMAFGLEFDNVFPVDIWGRRILTDLYGHNEKTKYSELSSWTKAYFNGYATWAGQYLFEWYREKS